jgi:gamma-glutamylaminecyclotransferase
MQYRIFVYGTLKRGLWNYERFLKGSAFVGEAVSVDRFEMIDVDFPVIRPDEEGQQVAGEIFTVDDEVLAELDRLEREGRSYHRHMMDFTLAPANGQSQLTKAFVYVGGDAFKAAFQRGPLYIHCNERGELDWQPQRHSQPENT